MIIGQWVEVCPVVANSGWHISIAWVEGGSFWLLPRARRQYLRRNGFSELGLSSVNQSVAEACRASLFCSHQRAHLTQVVPAVCHKGSAQHHPGTVGPHLLKCASRRNGFSELGLSSVNQKYWKSGLGRCHDERKTTATTSAKPRTQVSSVASPREGHSA